MDELVSYQNTPALLDSPKERKIEFVKNKLQELAPVAVVSHVVYGGDQIRVQRETRWELFDVELVVRRYMRAYAVELHTGTADEMMRDELRRARLLDPEPEGKGEN